MKKMYYKPRLSVTAESKGAIPLLAAVGAASAVAGGALVVGAARLVKAAVGTAPTSIPRLVSLEVVK